MIITVLTGFSPLLVIATYEKVYNARVFVNESVVKILRETASGELNCYESEDVFILDYEILNQEYNTKTSTISISDTPSCRTWYKVREFNFEDKHYKPPRNPELTMHIKMA